jgi:hypothetical protein
MDRPTPSWGSVGRGVGRVSWRGGCSRSSSSSPWSPSDVRGWPPPTDSDVSLSGVAGTGGGRGGSLICGRGGAATSPPRRHRHPNGPLFIRRLDVCRNGDVGRPSGRTGGVGPLRLPDAPPSGKFGRRRGLGPRRHRRPVPRQPGRPRSDGGPNPWPGRRLFRPRRGSWRVRLADRGRPGMGARLVESRGDSHRVVECDAAELVAGRLGCLDVMGCGCSGGGGSGGEGRG